MSTIHTGISIARPDLASLNRLNDGKIDADTARIGIRKDGALVVYTGRSYLLHPDQTRRAQQFLRNAGLLETQERPRDIRLVDLITRLNTHANTDTRPRTEDRAAPPRSQRPNLRWADTQAQARQAETATLSQRRGLSLNLTPAAGSLDDRKASLAQTLGSSDKRVGLFAELQRQVGPAASGAPFVNDLAGARFGDVPTAAATLVRAPDGTPLPANRVRVGGANVAIASQYPTAGQLESYFGMLVVNRTPVLVVLASDTDLAKPGMPRYFAENGRYGQTEVSAKAGKSMTLEGGLEVRSHQLTVQNGSGKISIPVLHVPNWADFGAQGAGALKALAEHVDAVADQKIAFYRNNNSRALGDPNKLLPVIHCRAGVGRTGQLIAARELLKPGAASLESIVSDMRVSRNHLMVQTAGQLSTLADLADQQGRAILKTESTTEPVYANDAPPLPPRRHN
ncbi:protein-tyrosine phosphatase family protein [Chromobacterium vaccinii]|uniref:protein-tyrosine phosphatase family protein n=1 Tax=Chromobacterium vaccinii TaxID=1108595 RepID=UPI003C74B79F